MDFIFQHGEFTNEESSFYTILGLFLNLFGILASGYVAINVFRKGQEAEIKKETDRLIELESYVKNMIMILDDPIQKQVNQIQQFSDKLKSKIEEHYTIQEIVTLHLRQLSEIPHSDLFKIFVTNKKGSIEERTKVFAKFNSEIEYLNFFKINLKNKFDHFWRNYEKYRDDWNEQIKDLMRLRDLMVHEDRVATLKDLANPLVGHINVIYIEWMLLENNREMLITKEGLIDPIQNLVRKHTSNSRAREIAQIARDANHVFENMKTLKELSLTLFVQSEKRLLKAKENLNEAMAWYNKH